MNTPSHHRVHHGRNPRYLDANYAGRFHYLGQDVRHLSFRNCPKLRRSITGWCATWGPSTRSGWRFTSGSGSSATFGSLVLAWRRAPDVRAWRPPGWSHDGSRDTSEQIKRKHLADHPEDAGTPGFAEDPR